MTEVVPPTLNSQTAPSWRSPLLIAGVLIAVFVLGGATFMLLTKQPEQREITSTGLVVSPIGTSINRDTAVEKLNQSLNEDPQNKFLTFSYLRTTYSGGLVQMTENDVTNADDSAVALVLELTKGETADITPFPITKAELANIQVFSVGSNGTGPITYKDLAPNDGLSITRVSDLMSAQNAPDQIVIEATKQEWQ